MNRTAELFNNIGEYFTAGSFEDENALYNARNAMAIGGNGWIHYVPNYERVLDVGLIGYKKQLDAKSDKDFYRPLKQVLDCYT